MKSLAKSLIVAFFLISLDISAQPTLIRVDGIGSDVYKPDEAIIQLYLTSEARTAREAYQQMEEKLKILSQVIKKSGYSDTILKVQNIQVSKFWNADKQKEKSYQATFNGNIKLPAKTLEVTELVEKIETQVSTTAYVNFTFSAALQKSIKESLMVSALEDAKKQALKIAGTYGMNNLLVKEINYTSQMPIYAPRTYQREKMSLDASYAVGSSIDMSIQEQEFSEMVQVIFESK